MQKYSLLVVTDYNVPFCKIEFEYEFISEEDSKKQQPVYSSRDDTLHRFKNIKIETYRPDIEYRPWQWWPYTNRLTIGAYKKGTAQTPVLDNNYHFNKKFPYLGEDYASSIEINIPEKNTIKCYQCLCGSLKEWNKQTINNNGVYVVTKHVDLYSPGSQLLRQFAEKEIVDTTSK